MLTDSGKYVKFVRTYSCVHIPESGVSRTNRRDFRYALDCRKAKREFNCAPLKSLEEGLTETVAYYGTHLRR